MASAGQVHEEEAGERGIIHPTAQGGWPQGRAGAQRFLAFPADTGKLTSFSHLVICEGGEGSTPG